MRYYIIAGETSGDLHASNLIKALKKHDPEASFRGFGGDYSQEAGLDLAMHYREISYMGFVEVLTHLHVFRRAVAFCKADILSWKPDVIITIDFAGFNLRIAQFAKDHGIPTYYYISPKIWAWQESRGHKIKRVVDRMFTILPFEQQFYKNKFGFGVEYVGNPVADAVANFRPNPNFFKDNQLLDRPIIAVLPGSRRQEIEEMLHFMISIIPPYLRDYQFVVAALPHLPQKYYEGFRRHESIKIVYGQAYDVLANARAAIVTSGTATLETALFEVPQVVCYKTNPVTYMIAKMLVKVKHISLPNLIVNREMVRELIQDQFNPSNLMVELDRVLKDGPFREQQLAGYRQLKEIIGQPGASNRAAELMVKYLKEDRARAKAQAAKA